MAGRESSLFIGRLSKNVRTRDIEEIFEVYGRMSRCEVKYGAEMAYAFIDFEDRRDAEDALKYENGKDLLGSSILVEWARGLPRPRGAGPPRRRGGGGGYRGRDNYDDRRGASNRYRSPPRRRSRSPRRRRSRSRSDSLDRSKRHRRGASKSPSRSPRSASHSRSRSP